MKDENAPVEPQEKKKIPGLIIVVSLLIFISAGSLGAKVVFEFSTLVQNEGVWYPIWLGFSALILFISGRGLLALKRWGVFLYLIMVGLNQVMLAIRRDWNVISVIFPAVILVIAFSQFSKLNR